MFVNPSDDEAGAHFTNDFLLAIQIPLLAIRSQHATTAQLSCHIQNL